MGLFFGGNYLLQAILYSIYNILLSCSLQELTKDSEEPLEVIFVSSDNSPEELMAYMNELHGDWLAVQHGAVLAE